MLGLISNAIYELCSNRPRLLVKEKRNNLAPISNLIIATIYDMNIVEWIASILSNMDNLSRD